MFLKELYNLERTDSQNPEPYTNRFWGKPFKHLLMFMNDVQKNPLKAVTDQHEYALKARCSRAQ